MSPSGSANEGRTVADCLFCKIVRKEIPANLVEEDHEFVAFRDINPQSPTHVLVIPKEHLANITEAGEDGHLGRLFQKACAIAEKEALKEGFRIVVNTGDDGGQTVHHLHVHVLGGRRLSWPPG